MTSFTSNLPTNRCVFHYTYSNGVSLITLPFTFEQVAFGDPLDAIYDNYQIVNTTLEILPESEYSYTPQLLDNALPYWGQM